MALAPAPAPRRPLTELAAGVDALYLSGRSFLPPTLAAELEAGRVAAEAAGTPSVFNLGGLSCHLAGHGWGKYRYCLDHATGGIGLTPSTALPTVRVQPRSEVLHALGPADTVAAFDGPVRAALLQIHWSVSRIDLHADWQGFALHRDLSERFVGRATARSIYEDGDLCTGFTFGKRKGSRITARLYDKLVDIEAKGSDFWFDIWGERFDPSLGVHRLEFEWGREALKSMQLSSPAEVLAALGDLWRYSTSEWLTLRTVTDDQTRSRSPLAPEWIDIQQSTLSHDQIGLARLTEGSRRGALRLLMPQLNGFVSSAAVHLDTEGIDETLAALEPHLRDYEIRSGESFVDRVARKRRERFA